jgi:toxin CcdB
MARFDVYQQSNRTTLLVNCQSPYLDHLSTRFVVPLIPAGAKPPNATRLNPVILFDSVSYVLAPNAAATIQVTQTGRVVGSLVDERDAITTAIDMLVTGF